MKKKLVTVLIMIALSVSAIGCSSTKEATENDTIATSIQYPVEDDEDDDIGEVSTYIDLNDNINVNGEGVTVENNIITITSAGTYSITGTLVDGQIVVNASNKENVNLLLNGVNVTCSNSSAINIESCKNAIIALADNTTNVVTDGESYVFEDSTTDEPSAAIFSKDDLKIIGNGSLQVNANYKNGIQSKDDLKVKGGNITVTSVGDGLKGKDSVTITDGTIDINAKGDGIQSNNDKDASKGYVYITGGSLNINSDQDGIQAETNLIITNGDITVETGEGSENGISKVRNDNFGGFGMKRDETVPREPADKAPTDEITTMPANETTATAENSTTDTVSAKALKATSNIVIDGGNISIDSSDDSVHSNGALIINDGTLNIKSGDDGLHSDATLDINGGSIDITKSYEGIESEVITIKNGTIHVTSSDDGVNASGGSDSSVSNEGPGKNAFSSSSTGKININGGYLVIDSTGDGIDSNGSVAMSGGTVIVNGPTNGGNGALDYDSEFNMTGGCLIASGSVGMVQTPSSSSTQNTLNITLTSKDANNLIHIEDVDGNEVLTFAPSKTHSSIVVCTAEIKQGTTYNVYSGGNSTGTAVDGLYSDGIYSEGSQIGSGSVSSSITNVTESGASNSSGMGGHQGNGGKGDMPFGEGKPEKKFDNKEKIK